MAILGLDEMTPCSSRLGNTLSFCTEEIAPYAAGGAESSHNRPNTHVLVFFSARFWHCWRYFSLFFSHGLQTSLLLYRGFLHISPGAWEQFTWPVQRQWLQDTLPHHWHADKRGPGRLPVLFLPSRSELVLSFIEACSDPSFIIEFVCTVIDYYDNWTLFQVDDCAISYLFGIIYSLKRSSVSWKSSETHYRVMLHHSRRKLGFWYFSISVVNYTIFLRGIQG